MPSTNVSFQPLGWSTPIPVQFWVLSQLNPHQPRPDSVSSPSGVALGRGSSNAQGGMLPRVGQGARKSKQVSKLFRAQLKHTFPGRGICMENGGGKLPPLVPSLEGRVRDDQVKPSQLDSKSTWQWPQS